MLYRPKSNKAPAGNASIASATRRGLSDHVVWRPLTELRPYPHNARKHPQAQIERLMRAMKAAYTNPVLIDENDTILAGHGRLEAAKRLAMSNIATLTFFGLSEAEKRSVVIADNRIPEQATWDFQVLKSNFSALIDIDFDVELTGFTTGEVDLIIDESPEPEAETCDETFSVDGPAVSRLGDKWLLGAHSILCADAQLSASYRELMGNVIAQMVVSDFPYNVKMSSVVGRGKIRHRASSRWHRVKCRVINSRIFWLQLSATSSTSAPTARSITSSWTGVICCSFSWLRNNIIMNRKTF
jgi:hypothetical protein